MRRGLWRSTGDGHPCWVLRPQGQECGPLPTRLSGSKFHLDVNSFLSARSPTQPTLLPQCFLVL